MRIFIWIVVSLLNGSLLAAASGLEPKAVQSVRMVLPKNATPEMRNIAEVFKRQVHQRCTAKVVADGAANAAQLALELAVVKDLGEDEFRIEARAAGGVRITGQSAQGLVAGVGKFLRTSRYDQGGFTPGEWRGTSVPTRHARGIYFATHFHNFYHEAPIPEIERYVEDLALWGLNELVVWYDTHHFNGADDPKAVEFRKRLHAIMAAAKRSAWMCRCSLSATKPTGIHRLNCVRRAVGAAATTRAPSVRANRKE